MQKDDLIELLIEDTGVNGEGIGHFEGMTFFIKDSLEGDIVKAKIIKMKKNFGYGRLMEIIKPSPYRTQARCQVYKQCGGCQIQALSYERQLKFKQNKVINNLKRIGGFEDIVVNETIGMDKPWYYRNKAQFPVGKDKNGNILVGFYAGRTHSIIESEHCYIGRPENEKIVEAVKEYMEENKVPSYDEKSGQGLIRHILVRVGFKTDEIIVCLVIAIDKLPKQEKLIEKLSKIENLVGIDLNINKEKTNVILGKESHTIWGRSYIVDYIGNIKYQISPQSFYQVNPVQTKKLYDKALEYADLKGNETVWDLYCGIGTITLFLSQKAKMVYGVEIIPKAVENAKNNAKINNIENVEFFLGKAEEVLPDFYKNSNKGKAPDTKNVDVIVVDPPRSGCDEKLLETILLMEPEKVIYVSCDSATLSRDLKYLCQSGKYSVHKVQPVDMFPHTVHVEVVVSMSRVGSRQ
ncbi:23S rRNA m(5)U-1939 methyltransferase [Acetitomaculum ruminis DSM 5522]|uniref:23S rRNA m(5)U-1939 methyltransferase n=1 Tax=Acetitomaculum ruminis DSM 5522 TaxID=1120918 RepID=A0A1I0XFW4_9FIRM|nr:23S rRNA (uracil(1939)-C(5))-methyltransferase RlmD [Acetitomaculum ruminis]SFA99190.1 23S rRNA m(5)U-1939 methyltransferase [Acetitomaculum ruminis DSM 5522]